MVGPFKRAVFTVRCGPTETELGCPPCQAVAAMYDM